MFFLQLYLIDADAKRMEKINLDTNEKCVVPSASPSSPPPLRLAEAAGLLVLID